MKDLSPGAKLTYALLCSYANKEGECFPSEERMADDLQTSDRTIRRYTTELTGKGMIEKKLSGTMPAHNVYRVLYPVDDSKDTGVLTSRTLVSDLIGHRDPSKNTKEKNNNVGGALKEAPRQVMTEEEFTSIASSVPWKKAR